jgi:competence protein ComEA
LRVARGDARWVVSALGRAGMSEGSVRGRISMLSRGELAGLVGVLVVCLAGAGLWYVRSLPRPVQVRAQPVAAAATSSASPTVSPAVVLVDVAGWVRHPGVYELHADDRVIDALEAAGGARPGAQLEALNLAASLVDGTQILVPKAGAAPIAEAAAPGTAGTATKININTASADELDALPSVGEVIAQRIIDYRTQNGPFASIEDIQNVSGIGSVTFEDMKDLITV